MKENKCRRLETNLLAQNVYVRDVVLPLNVNTGRVKTYPELERVDSDFGFEEKVVERDYPITPESVSSYAETADYRNNLQQALNMPARGKNLGDVRDAQHLSDLDSSEISARIALLQEVLSKKQEVEQKPVVEQQPVVEDK